MNFKLKIGIILLALAISYQLSTLNSFAQTQTIRVSPQLIQLDLSKDKPEAEYTYTNNTSQTIELTLSMQDVKELEDRGIPGLLNSNESANYKYGLSSWASFSNKNLVIASGESKKVTVFIDKTRLTLGGHYASVLAEVRQLQAKKTVKLRAIISSLLFVRSGSEYEQEDAKIVEIKPLRDWFAFPKTASFRIQNTGNVDITPYGLLQIYDSFGREVARGIVNEGSLITLPDSLRRYEVDIKPTQIAIAPGMYKAKLSLHFGKKNVKKEKEITFMTFGSANILGIGAGILVCSGLYFGLRKFKKRQKTQSS